MVEQENQIQVQKINKLENEQDWIEDLTLDLKNRSNLFAEVNRKIRGVKAQPFRWGETCEKSHWRRPAMKQWI